MHAQMKSSVHARVNQCTLIQAMEFLQGLHASLAQLLPIWAQPYDIARMKADLSYSNIGLPALHPEVVQPMMLQLMIDGLSADKQLYQQALPNLPMCMVWFVSTIQHCIQDHSYDEKHNVISHNNMIPYMRLIGEHDCVSIFSIHCILLTSMMYRTYGLLILLTDGCPVPLLLQLPVVGLGTKSCIGCMSMLPLFCMCTNLSRLCNCAWLSWNLQNGWNWQPSSVWCISSLLLFPLCI